MEELAAVKIKTGGNGVVEPWDVTYLQNLAEQSEQLKQADEGGWKGNVGEALERLQEWTHDFLGMKLEESQWETGEGWVGGASKYSLKESDGSLVGVIYFDLGSRQDKYNHSAHFTIQGGCEEWSSDYTSVTGRSVPRVCVVMNLEGTLTVGSLETLFHEYGHALHSVMSKTRY